MALILTNSPKHAYQMKYMDSFCSLIIVSLVLFLYFNHILTLSILSGNILWMKPSEWKWVQKCGIFLQVWLGFLTNFESAHSSIHNGNQQHKGRLWNTYAYIQWAEHIFRRTQLQQLQKESGIGEDCYLNQCINKKILITLLISYVKST